VENEKQNTVVAAQMPIAHLWRHNKIFIDVTMMLYFDGSMWLPLRSIYIERDRGLAAFAKEWSK